MKVRITRTPREHELDGVRLDRLQPGVVREVPPDLATWLVAERYADVEMRQGTRPYDEDFLETRDTGAPPRDPGAPRRRFDD